MSQTSTKNSADGEVQVPMTDVVGFVRQLSHDLRNNLNAAELQSAFLNEIAPDAELKGEIKRLREMLTEMGGNLQRLTTQLAQVKLNQMPYEAVAFVEDLQQKLASQFPEQAKAIDWESDLAGKSLNIDPQLLQQAFIEFFTNALQHGRAPGQLAATATIDGEDFVFALREPKNDFNGSLENWGRQPFHKVAHGHYGLGLHRARSIIEAHGGRLDVRYDSVPSELVTTVSLPIAVAE